MSKPYYGVLAATSVWMTAIFAPSLTTAWGSASGALAYLFFQPICHQLPARSFHLWGMQLAVCHRCLGIYLGFWLGLVLLPFFSSCGRYLLEHPRILLLFSLPLIMNVLITNSPPDRFLTGLIAGFPVSVFVLAAVEQVFVGRSRRSL